MLLLEFFKCVEDELVQSWPKAYEESSSSTLTSTSNFISPHVVYKVIEDRNNH